MWRLNAMYYVTAYFIAMAIYYALKYNGVL
jgi:hypothetical protein